MRDIRCKAAPVAEETYPSERRSGRNRQAAIGMIAGEVNSRPEARNSKLNVKRVSQNVRLFYQ